MKRLERLGSWISAAALAGLTACSDARAPEVTERATEPMPSVDAAVATLKAAHPKAKVRVQNERIRRVFGTLATGKTPSAAAENFRLNSAAALGVDAADLSPSSLVGGAGFKAWSCPIRMAWA
jgi:hypothetical protein